MLFRDPAVGRLVEGSVEGLVMGTLGEEFPLPQEGKRVAAPAAPNNLRKSRLDFITRAPEIGYFPIELQPRVPELPISRDADAEIYGVPLTSLRISRVF